MKLRFPQTQIVRFNRTSPSLPLTLSSEVTLSFYNYSTKLTFRAYSWFYYYLIKIIIWIFKRSYHRKGVYNEYETGDILPPPIDAGASWDVSANADIITRLSPFVQWFYMFHFFYSKNTATLSFDIDCCVYIALQHCSAFFTAPYPIG